MDLCINCGHEEDEHDLSGFYKPCNHEGCFCDDYEGV